MTAQDRRKGRKGKATVEKRRLALAAALAAILSLIGLAAVLVVTIPRILPEQVQPEVEAAPEEIAVGPAVGMRAPGFTLESLDGESVTLADYLGQTVILDFWASWCTPCQVTFPSLHALWKTFADRGVVLIGISLDRTRSDAESFIHLSGYADMIALWGSYRSASLVALDYGVEGIPNTLVIDAQGIVRFNGHPSLLTATRLASYFE